jgi:hypothetical protein
VINELRMSKIRQTLQTTQVNAGILEKTMPPGSAGHTMATMLGLSSAQFLTDTANYIQAHPEIYVEHFDWKDVAQQLDSASDPAVLGQLYTQAAFTTVPTILAKPQANWTPAEKTLLVQAYAAYANTAQGPLLPDNVFFQATASMNGPGLALQVMTSDNRSILFRSIPGRAAPTLVGVVKQSPDGRYARPQIPQTEWNAAVATLQNSNAQLSLDNILERIANPPPNFDPNIQLAHTTGAAIMQELQDLHSSHPLAYNSIQYLLQQRNLTPNDIFRLNATSVTTLWQQIVLLPAERDMWIGPSFDPKIANPVQYKTALDRISRNPDRTSRDRQTRWILGQMRAYQPHAYTVLVAELLGQSGKTLNIQNVDIAITKDTLQYLPSRSSNWLQMINKTTYDQHSGMLQPLAPAVPTSRPSAPAPKPPQPIEPLIIGLQEALKTRAPGVINQALNTLRQDNPHAYAALAAAGSELTEPGEIQTSYNIKEIDDTMRSDIVQMHIAIEDIRKLIRSVKQIMDRTTFDPNAGLRGM